MLVQSAAPKDDAKASLKDEKQPQDQKHEAARADKTARETAKKDKAELKAAPPKAAKDIAQSKADEDKPAAQTAEAPVDPALPAADMPQPEIPPAPQPQLIAAAAPGASDDGEDEMTAVPAADAPPALAVTAPQMAAAEPAPQPAQLQAPAPDASSQAAQAVAQQNLVPAAPQPAAPQPAAAQASPPPAETQIAALTAAKPAPSAESDAAKPGARKAEASKDNGKDKSEEGQGLAPRRDAQPFDIPVAAAPKAQAQTQLAPDTGLAVHTVGAAPAQPASSPNLAPQLTQHVQVTAEPPKPNMPALAVEIAARTQSGAKQFDIRLDPPELGRVEVRLSIDATGKASAHLSADQPQTLDLLQKDAPILARALRDAGLDVAQDGLNFSLRQQAQNQGQGQNGALPRGHARGARLTAITGIEDAPAAIAIRANGRLDIRV